jgi:hypothetical protein
MSSLPLQFLLLTVAGWITRNQNCMTEYFVAESAVLREQLRGQRIRYTDAQRRKLAIAANKLGRRELSMLDTLVTPMAETALRPLRTADPGCSRRAGPRRAGRAKRSMRRYATTIPMREVESSTPDPRCH